MSIDQEAMEAATRQLPDEIDHAKAAEKPAKPEPKAETKPEPKEDAVAPEPDEVSEEDGSDDGTEHKSKPGKWMRKALKTEAQLELAQREIERLRGTPPVEAPKPAEPVKPADDEPKIADFETYDDFIVAKAEWKTEQKAKAKEAEATKAKEAEKAAEVHKTFAERVEAAKERFDDFEEVAFRRDYPVTPLMVDAIRESEHGPDIAYWLGKNPDEAKRIAGLSPLAQAKAIGRLEARFDKEDAPEPVKPPPPKTRSEAPKPPAKVQSRGSAERNPSDMSMSEYRAWRKAGGGK